MAGGWRVPDGFDGDASLVRISASMLTQERYVCRAQLAAKARPAVWPSRRSRAAKERAEMFAFGPIQAVLDRVEFHSDTFEAAVAALRGYDKPLHPGLTRYARHAAAAYLALGAVVDGHSLLPVAQDWVAQKRDAQTWELHAWGRRYQSPDGSLREFRFLRHRPAGRRQRDLAQVAVAAYAAAFGSPAPRPAFAAAYAVDGKAVCVRRVRVVEVAFADGSCSVLFDGTPAQAEAFYAEHARARVNLIPAGGPAKAGSGCAKCKLTAVCDDLPRVPNLLGVTGPQAPLRTWSVSNGRYYALCPAQDHMHRLSLPRDGEYGPDAILGQAVHEWLEAAHARRPFRPCTAGNIPRSPTDLPSERWPLTQEQLDQAAAMIRHHAAVCAFQHVGRIDEVRTEPDLAFHDTAANTLVIAQPDLVYREHGSWVYRETKTTSKPRRFEPDPLDAHPQLALAVLLLAEAALGGDPTGSRVELETLRTARPDIEIIDPTDPLRVSKAREIIRELVQPWHGDHEYRARTGPHCQSCPVSQWCPDFPGPHAAVAERDANHDLSGAD